MHYVTYIVAYTVLNIIVFIYINTKILYNRWNGKICHTFNSDSSPNKYYNICLETYETQILKLNTYQRVLPNGCAALYHNFSCHLHILTMLTVFKIFKLHLQSTKFRNKNTEPVAIDLNPSLLYFNKDQKRSLWYSIKYSSQNVKFLVYIVSMPSSLYSYISTCVYIHYSEKVSYKN